MIIKGNIKDAPEFKVLRFAELVPHTAPCCSHCKKNIYSFALKKHFCNLARVVNFISCFFLPDIVL